MASPASSGKFPVVAPEISVGEIHDLLESDVIYIIASDLELALRDHATNLERRNSWIAPAGVIITLIVTLITTETKKVGFSADTWTAIFFISTVLSAGWFVYELRNSMSAVTVEDLMSKIKSRRKKAVSSDS